MKGHVVATDGDRVRVVLARPAACAGCGQLRACNFDGERRHAVRVPACAGLEAGAAVDVEIPPALGLQYALWAYGVPLLAWVGGVLVGAGLGPRLGIPRDPAGLAGGIVGLAGALVVLRQADGMFRRRLDQDLIVSIDADGAPQKGGQTGESGPYER